MTELTEVKLGPKLTNSESSPRTLHFGAYPLLVMLSNINMFLFNVEWATLRFVFAKMKCQTGHFSTIKFDKKNKCKDQNEET